MAAHPHTRTRVPAYGRRGRRAAVAEQMARRKVICAAYENGFVRRTMCARS